MAALRKLVISLSGAERSALADLAERERRDLRDQAAVIIRCELERAGLLPIEPTQPPGQSMEAEVRDSTSAS